MYSWNYSCAGTTRNHTEHNFVYHRFRFLSQLNFGVSFMWTRRTMYCSTSGTDLRLFIKKEQLTFDASIMRYDHEDTCSGLLYRDEWRPHKKQKKRQQWRPLRKVCSLRSTHSYKQMFRDSNILVHIFWMAGLQTKAWKPCAQKKWNKRLPLEHSYF